MLYCDRCARKHGYDLSFKVEHGECQICHQKLGKMNVMDEDQYFRFLAKSSPIGLDVGGLNIQQIEGFVPGTNIDHLEPGARRQYLSRDTVIFQKSKSLVIADLKSGKRVEVQF